MKGLHELGFGLIGASVGMTITALLVGGKHLTNPWRIDNSNGDFEKAAVAKRFFNLQKAFPSPEDISHHSKNAREIWGKLCTHDERSLSERKQLIHFYDAVLNTLTPSDISALEDYLSQGKAMDGVIVAAIYDRTLSNFAIDENGNVEIYSQM